ISNENLKKIKVDDIKKTIQDIYSYNGLDVNVIFIKNLDQGKKLYDAFKSKLLPTGHVVISLGYAIFENSSQAGIMATPYEKSSELVESLYDIRPAIDAQKQDPIAKLFNSA